MARTALTKVKCLSADQRQRRCEIETKRKGLTVLLKSLRTSSDRAIEMIGQLQNMHETCLSVGNVVCSKVQHSVALNDADSTAVAGSVAAIEFATENVATSSEKGCEFIRVHNQLCQVLDSVMSSHKHTSDALEAMCNTHACAVVVHEHALEVIESDTVMQCVVCKCIPERAYAARTGMCKNCLQGVSMNSGWVRCG
jgi:hypothetical protein